MKNFNKIILMILVISTTGITGCSDILDQEPLSITHPDVYWDSQANAESALAGSYGLLKFALTAQASFLYWGEFPAMTFMNSKNWVTDYIEGSGNYVLPYRDYTRDWKDFYRAANWAFTIEKYVSEMPDEVFTSVSEKNRIIGEAAFVRSLSYFYVAKIWGDAPIITESIESSDQLINEDGFIVDLARSDEKEVLSFALEAANKSIELLEYSTPGQPKWAITANRASAEALKAHIALWYASRDNGNPELIQESIDAATNVIQNSNASLIDYVNGGEDAFVDMVTGQSETGLFEINISTEDNESFSILNYDSYHTGLTLNYPIFATENGSGPYMDPDFYGNEFMRTDSDRANDVRKDLFFYMYNSPDDSFLNKYAQSSDDPDSEDAYALFSESNILIFRLADIYLLRAEAYAQLDKSGEAVDDINSVREKAGVLDYTGPTDKPSLIKAIFEERAIELVGEGQSAFDRIRMDYFEGVPWMNDSRKNKDGYFWPIDQSLISINPALIQTEYWQGAL